MDQIIILAQFYTTRWGFGDSVSFSQHRLIWCIWNTICVAIHYTPPSTCLRQRPSGLWSVGPTRRDHVCSQEREPDPFHVHMANRSALPAFLALTACWDVDTLWCTCFRSDRKQIYLASFTQPVSLRKYYLQIKYYVGIVLSPIEAS